MLRKYLKDGSLNLPNNGRTTLTEQCLRQSGLQRQGQSAAFNEPVQDGG
jgi:hypothetical protein